MSNFDFNNIAGLGAFWDGTKTLNGGTSMPGGGQFNTYSGQAGVNHNLDLLYQNLIGRNADPGGKDYWAKQIASGATDYAGVADAIKASGEYTDQQTAIAGGASAGDLKNLGSAYVSAFHADSGSAAAGWKPGDAITASIANSVASNYADQTNKTVADLPPGSTGGTGGTGLP